MSQKDFQIQVDKQIVKFTLHRVPDKPGKAAEIFDRLSQAGFNVELVVQTTAGGTFADISFVVRQDQFNALEADLKSALSSVAAEDVSKDENTALVTLEKENLSKIPGTAARMFRTLAKNNINIDIISTSLHSITCLISANSADEAATALRAEFELK